MYKPLPCHETLLQGSQTASINQSFPLPFHAPFHLYLPSAISNSLIQSPISLSLALQTLCTNTSIVRILFSTILGRDPGAGKTKSLIMILAPGCKAGIKLRRVLMAYLSEKAWKTNRKKYASATSGWGVKQSCAVSSTRWRRCGGTLPMRLFWRIWGRS